MLPQADKHMERKTLVPHKALQADYIITGAGCAGLSLAMHMAASGSFGGKKILLLDQEKKQSNDRTWCFWEKEAGLFQSIVFREWQRIWFADETDRQQLSISPYIYKMIRGIDFYNYCRKELSAHPQISFISEKVESIFSDDKSTGVVVNGEALYCEHVFNSILFEKPVLKKNEYWLFQHFKGWIIETETDAFDPDAATLMDFRTSQQQGTAFCYVLPFSARRALVEYTLFSPSLLEPDAYRQGLELYIRDVLGIAAYRILDEEQGMIPMTNHRFERGRRNITNIGTAGGQTKGSSGYTFQFIQKHSRAIVQAMEKTGRPGIAAPSSRFHFYDSVLLNILQHGRLPGKEVFARLFRNNPAPRVLRFLDNESSLKEELSLIATLPTLPFTRAALQQLF